MTVRYAKRCGRPIRFIFLVGAVLGFSFWLTASTVAQDGPDEPPDPYVKILAREPLATGGIRTRVEIRPTDDATIMSGLPNSRFGDSLELRLGYNTANGAQRILLLYDLDEIPDNATIERAEVELDLREALPAAAPPMDTQLHRIGEPWNESIVTWNNQPDIGGVRDETVILREPGEYEWDIDDLVQDWIDGDRDNEGVMILGSEGVSVNERVFFSSESGIAIEQRPRLVVEYTEEPPNTLINPLPAIVNVNSFTVSWTVQNADDDDVDYYDVFYNFNGGADWFVLVAQTEATSAGFTVPFGDGIYGFEARARLESGVLEEQTRQAEVTLIVDANPPFVIPRAWLPAAFSQ